MQGSKSDVDREEEEFGSWLHPPPYSESEPLELADRNQHDSVDAPRHADQSITNPMPSGLYGVVERMGMIQHRPLDDFLTKHSVGKSNQNILCFRMPHATRTVKKKQQEHALGSKGTLVSSSSSCVSTSESESVIQVSETCKSQFNWAARLEESGWHWLWFKYGPALAHLLRTTLKCELPIWMTFQFDVESLDVKNGSEFAGPVLFKRKLVAMKVDSSTPSNIQSSEPSHSLFSPFQRQKPAAKNYLYTAHALPSMNPSYKFQLFEQAAITATSRSSRTNEDNGLLSFHQVLRWLHAQLGLDSECNFDLDAALKASADMEQKSRLLCQGIQAGLELQYLARLFPDVWCTLHPSFLSKFQQSNSCIHWSEYELNGANQSVSQFVCAMDPTVGLRQVDLQVAQRGVQSIQLLLNQLNDTICSRYHSQSVLFLPRSQLLEKLKDTPSNQNLLGWHLKSRDEQGGVEEQQNQQLVRSHLAIFARAIQSTHLPFSLLAICPNPEPHPSYDLPSAMTTVQDPWSEYGDGAEYRFTDSSQFFVPCGVPPLEAVPVELLNEEAKWKNREMDKSFQERNATRGPTPEQITESLNNSAWTPMCGGDQEMRHYHPECRWENCRAGFTAKRAIGFGVITRGKPVQLHKMPLVQPSKDQSSSSRCCGSCNLCRKNFYGPRYACIVHENDICLECGRESQIKWLQSIVDGFNAHRAQCEDRMIWIDPASMTTESDLMTVIRTLLRGDDASISTSESSFSSASVPNASADLWFDGFDLDRLLSDMWKKSPSLQSFKSLDMFKMEIGAATQTNVAQLIQYFHVSAAFRLAFAEYPSIVDAAFQKLISADQQTVLGLTYDDPSADVLSRLYPLHEEIRRSTELLSLSSISLNRMESVTRAASAMLRSLHSKVQLLHHGWNTIYTTNQVHTNILNQFNKPIVFGVLRLQHNGLSATTIIQQLIPCLARLFDTYYSNETKAGRIVSDDKRIQFWLKNEHCFLPNRLWFELNKVCQPDGLDGSLLLLPPVETQELRVSSLPYMHPYHNVTFGNDLYADPDHPLEGHEMTLEPVIRTIHQVLRDSTGSPLFDLEAILRLSAPIQSQSEIFERCVRVVESVLKLHLHQPGLDRKLRTQMSDTIPVDDQQFWKLHRKFLSGLSERGQFMEELDVETLRNYLKPFEQFARLIHSQQQPYCSIL